jgi:hypothetical protein
MPALSLRSMLDLMLLLARGGRDLPQGVRRLG